MLQKRFVHLKVFLNDGQVSRLEKRITFFQLLFFTNQPFYRFMQIAKSEFANFYILIKTRILLILLSRQRIVMLCAIQYHFSNLKNVKNIHGGVLLLVKFDAKACDLLNVTLLHGCFSRFLNCKNGTESLKASHFVVYRFSCFMVKKTPVTVFHYFQTSCFLEVRLMSNSESNFLFLLKVVKVYTFKERIEIEKFLLSE